MSRVKRTPKPLEDLPDKIPDLISLGLKVAAAGTNNTTLFANPDPKPQDILDASQALEKSHTATGPGTKGAVAARGPDEIALRNLLHGWANYLVIVAAKNVGQEAYVYETGGFGSRRTPVRNTDPLRLTQPKAYPSGKVRAKCKAAKRGVAAFYGWRISLDGGKTWTLSQTNASSTEFSNVPPGTEIQVQYNTTIKNVTSAWSGSVPLLVR
jgi:hypothetical protein